MTTGPIDKDKLRAFVRRQEGLALLVFLDRAIDLLPEAELPRLFEGHARPEQFRPDAESSAGLVDAVRRFHAASLLGEYYEAFSVNSRNCTDKSRGTQSWIAECLRLTELCVAASREQEHADVRGSMELIFDLLRQIDECRDDIIFFADEGGSWQVGVDWGVVLQAWFRSVSATTSAEEYATAVRGVIGEFASYDAGRLIQAARQAGTHAQRAALGT